MEQNQMHVHEFEEVVVAPTCKEPGYTLYQCACGYAHKRNLLQQLQDEFLQL